jgi:hypothetical protein
VRDFDDEYFLMLPDHFIYSHFPENQDWQLLDKPISKNMFADLPQVYRGFFSYGLSVNSNAKSMIESSGDVSVTVSAPSTVVLTALLMQGNRPLSTTLTLVQRTNNQYQINAICPDVGNYILRIYAKKSDDPGDFNSVLDYKIESNQASLPHASFPKTYGVFTTDNVYLNTPLSGYLAAGIVQHFDITVPNAGDVEIIMGDKWYPLTKQGESFVGEVNLVSGTLQVCAKLPNSIGQQYSVLIEYTVGS